MRSALLQRLDIECAQAKKNQWALLFWDIEKFYDTVGLWALLQRAEQRKYPLTMAVLLTTIYVSPRVVRCAGCCSEAVQPSRSILPGCGEAQTMAKVALYDIIDEVISIKHSTRLALYAVCCC